MACCIRRARDRRAIANAASNLPQSLYVRCTSGRTGSLAQERAEAFLCKLSPGTSPECPGTLSAFGAYQSAESLRCVLRSCKQGKGGAVLVDPPPANTVQYGCLESGGCRLKRACKGESKHGP